MGNEVSALEFDEIVNNIVEKNRDMTLKQISIQLNVPYQRVVSSRARWVDKQIIKFRDAKKSR